MKKIIVSLVTIMIFTQMQARVERMDLDNGLTVLVCPDHTIPKVSVQIWYNVGSKDEKLGEKGRAHLIEHMIFKGTKGKKSLNLSESDIKSVVHRLSGSCNAFTSYDYTGYHFEMPSHHWKQILPIVADCMTNCAFKDDHLNSEMKAVIQELKMIRDSYQRSLAYELVSTIFTDHPYHFPLIGYKQDLWTASGENLRSFYSKHYHPNNAALVVAGDVNPQDVFKLAKEYFGKIPANPDYKKEKFFINKDIISRSVVLYRDVQKPLIWMAYAVPGVKEDSREVLDIASLALGQGKGSRLYKKLVDEMQVATAVSATYWDLFDQSLFFIMVDPVKNEDIEKIIELVQQEVDLLAVEGLSKKELRRAINQAKMSYYSLLENIQHQGNEIGKYFLATGDENYAFNYLTKSVQELSQGIKNLFTDYFRASIMHKGMVLPLPKNDIQAWASLQKESDQEDEQFLSTRKRTTPVEPPQYANKAKITITPAFTFPKASELILSNGSKVLYYNNPKVPKIDLVIQLKARPYYDSAELPGLYTFVAAMLSEGTKNYTGTQLADELETRGISLHAAPGSLMMSVPTVELESGLELLEEVLSRPAFNNDDIEKVRTKLLAEIKEYWDDPATFSGQLVREHIYKGHPYSKNILGTEESVKKINREQLVDFYKKHFTPKGSRIAVVGDFQNYDIQETLEKTLGKWQGNEVKDITFPRLSKAPCKEIDYPINRDQVVLCMANLSIDRKDQDFDKLLIFDQIFGSGMLGSMTSRLFELREKTGLFYGIGGSLVSRADEQPGMVIVKTMVSLDRLKEAEKVIKETIDTVADTITEREFAEAKNAIINAQVSNFESNFSIAQSFLFLDKYGFAPDYFDKRSTLLASITLDDVKEAAKKLTHSDTLSIFRVGRVPAKVKA